MFTRISREKSFQDMMRENRIRIDRVFEPGETVFRRMPRGSRLPKHLLPAPSQGPYEVVRQPTHTSLILRDPATGKLVSDGALIPLDQILAGPRRARLEFAREEDSEVRPISKLIEGTTNAPDSVLRSGFKAGRRAGWGPLAGGAIVAYQTIANGPKSKELTIGRVLVNNRDQKQVFIQPYRAMWTGTRLVHRPLFQTAEGYSLTPGPTEAKETVRYEALVSQVEQLTGGELTHGCLRRLSDRG